MTKDGKIEIFMVDDSQVARDLLTYVFETDPNLTIIGYAENGEEALKWLKYQTPDVITMDITMPGLDGFKTTRRIMQMKPTPIVIISSGYNQEDQDKSFLAIEAGALAIIEKPQGIHDARLIHDLLETIHTISGSKLISHQQQMISKPVSPPSISRAYSEQTEHTHHISAIAIGASLGGPIAVEKILSQLPADFPVPIFLVQHISKGFTKGFAVWLQKTSKLSIKLANNGEHALPGYVYIAPDGATMTIQAGNMISISNDDKMHLQPSVGKLFQSIAQIHGPHAIGVLLTGMGKDGAAELLQMRKKGAFTIAQDEESCVIFGMPKEAIKIGAAKQILHLDQIAETLQRLSNNPKNKGN